MLLVGRTDDSFSLGAKTLRRAVTGRSLGIVAIHLDQLGIVDTVREGIRQAVKYILRPSDGNAR